MDNRAGGSDQSRFFHTENHFPASLISQEPLSLLTSLQGALLIAKGKRSGTRLRCAILSKLFPWCVIKLAVAPTWLPCSQGGRTMRHLLILQTCHSVTTEVDIAGLAKDLAGNIFFYNGPKNSWFSYGDITENSQFFADMYLRHILEFDMNNNCTPLQKTPLFNNIIHLQLY